MEDDVGITQENFEEELDYEGTFPGEKSRLKNLKEKLKENKRVLIIALIILVAIIVIALIACASVLIPVLIVTSGSDNDNGTIDDNSHGNDTNTTPSAPAELDPAIECCVDDFPYHDEIWNTIEYQVALEEIKLFKNRESECNRFLSRFNQLTGLNFTFENGEQSVRDEYWVKSDDCVKSQMQVRVRVYITGHKAGHTTIDSKYNSPNQQSVYDSPLYPSSTYAKGSFQKAEKDQHECSSKYARETRLKMKSPFWFTTCRSVMELYPGIFPGIKESDINNPVSNKTIAYWWVLEHTTNSFPTELSDGTTVYSRLDSTFTLQYNSQEDAIKGKTPNYGEWSYRLFPQSAGIDVNIDPEVSAQCRSYYNTMVSEFEKNPGC